MEEATAQNTSRFCKEDRFPAEAVEKYNWLHAVAETNGFIAPRAELVVGEKPVAVDFVPNFISLRQLYIRYLLRLPSRRDFLGVMRDVGRALGAIHNAQIPSSWACHRIGTEVQSEARRYGLAEAASVPLVPLHGDFGQLNVGISEDQGTVVILDPCANTDAPVEHHLVYGDPEIDLSLMLGFLEGQVFSPTIVLATRSRVIRAQLAFLEGYRAARPRINLESAFAYSYAFFAFRMKQLGSRRRLSTRLLYNNVRGNSTVQKKVARVQRFKSA